MNSNFIILNKEKYLLSYLDTYILSSIPKNYVIYKIKINDVKQTEILNIKNLNISTKETIRKINRYLRGMQKNNNEKYAKSVASYKGYFIKSNTKYKKSLLSKYNIK